MTTLKRCTKCRNSFPLTNEYFSASSSSKDGFRRSCKNCEHLDKRNMQKPPDGYKCCSRCKQLFPATTEYFYPDKVSKTGLRCYCINCSIEASHAFRTENPEQVLAWVYRWRQANHEKAKSYQRKHYHNHHEVERAKQREYSLSHSAEVVQRVKKWREQNPERAKIHRQVSDTTRRARLKQLPSTLTSDEWEYALEYFGYCCAVCNKSRALAADHWIPLSKGGGTTRDNIIPLCHSGGGSCNESKGARDPVEWLHWKFGNEQATEILSRITAYFKSLDC